MANFKNSEDCQIEINRHSLNFNMKRPLFWTLFILLEVSHWDLWMLQNYSLKIQSDLDLLKDYISERIKPHFSISLSFQIFTGIQSQASHQSACYVNVLLTILSEEISLWMSWNVHYDLSKQSLEVRFMLHIGAGENSS